MLLGLALILAQAPTPAAPTEAFKFDYLRMKDRIEADGQARRTIEVSVLLRTPAAVQQFGQLSVPYVDGYADVSFERLRLQKPSGAVGDVEDGQIEDLNPLGINAASIPLDIRLKKLTIPRLEPGDRLSYTLTTTFRPFVPGEAYGEMKFTPVPVEGPQVYELDIPAQSRLRVNVRSDLGASWEQLPSEKDRLVRRLSVTVPPMVVPSGGLTEAQVESLQIPDVAYTTFASWSKVGEWWWEMSRLQVRGDEATRKEALRIAAGKTTAREKIEAIAAFVSSGVRYLNVSFGVGRMQPRTAASVLSSRYGDCKDKVGLVMALAEAVGVEVRPVLIHSARHDLQDDTPGPHQFDHMIAAAVLGPAEKDWLWMDATNSFSSPTALDPRTRDKRALVIDRKGHGVIMRTPARPAEPTHRLIDLKAALDPEGLLKGHARMEDRSDSEPNLRASFASVAPEQHAELMKSLLARTWNEARISSVRVGDPADIVTPFWVEFDFEREVKGIDSEKEWKLWVPDFGPVLLEAPTDATLRKPVRFEVDQVTFKAQVTLPEGVTARGPLSISMDRAFARLDSNYAVEGRTLRVERTLRFPVPSLDRDQLPAYEALRKAASTDREQDFVIGPVKSAAPSASALQKEGKAAYERKEYAKAIELLQKAAAQDPKLPEVSLDLGLALRESEKYEEAVAQYAKAIEADPFHDRIYAERAYVLFELGRSEEAEKDLLKQIEVAPFKAWSYRRLAERRFEQRRYKEAEEFYTKSLTIEPKEVDDWLALGWAQASMDKATEARQSFEKADALGLRMGQRVYVGLGYRKLGDLKTAGTFAEKDLDDLNGQVSSLTADAFTETQLFWVNRLNQAWLLIGEAALEAGDLERAERFLGAAWEGGFFAPAAYALGRVQEKRGALGKTAGLWAASLLAGPWDDKPSDIGERLNALWKKGFKDTGKEELERLRYLNLPGPVDTDFEEEVLVHLSFDKVRSVKNLSKRHEKEASPIIERLVGLRAPIPAPDGRPTSYARKGLLTCHKSSGCAVVHITGPHRPPALQTGKISISRITPADGTMIKAGELVRLSLSVDYELEGSVEGKVMLVVNDGNPTSLLVTPQPERVVKPGKGTVTFEAQFKVPEGTSAVQVFLPLSNGAPGTSTVAYARFPVKP